MPRDIPVGNGQLLVTFDQHYQLRDLYFPHVGQENHTGGSACRFGVWARLPDNEFTRGDRRKRRLYWTNQGWDINLNYKPETMATDVAMNHPVMEIGMKCSDVVDFHRALLVRRIEVTNLNHESRTIHLFHHNNFEMYGTKVGDTAYFDPQLRSLVHYRKNRYLMTSWFADGEQRIDEYATGTAGFFNAEGTWRDAEDGSLGGNSIAQGAVDSTMMLRVQLAPQQTTVVYMVLGAGKTIESLHELQQFVCREGPQQVIDRTTAYWRLWLAACRTQFAEPDKGGPSDRLIDLFKRSLLVVRTQIDNNGAIIAANDTDIMQFSRDTYSYLWPRDGALVAAALDDAGFPDVARSFYKFCAEIIDPGGYFLHKYNPDGSPASSWHPWVSMGNPQLPIQEDETALVIWALWRHYQEYRDIEFVRPLWVDLITKAADFLVRFRDPKTKLPLPSYDLWEERWGVHSFTVATVYGGLNAARQFAVCFGDTVRADSYQKAMDELVEAFGKYFWSEDDQRFLRRIVPLDHDRTAALMAEVMAGRDPGRDDQFAMFDAKRSEDKEGKEDSEKKLEFELDSVIDSSCFALFAMGMLGTDDERMVKTMRAVEDRLWVKTPVGGVARYENDYYHRVSDDIRSVPGNPWFICTLWLADWRIAKAKTVEELREALPIMEWVANHALPSDVLAEQVHPETNAPLSVSPLTWSHATVVSTMVGYQQKLNEMTKCESCGQPRLATLPVVPPTVDADSPGESDLDDDAGPIPITRAS